MSSRYEAKSRTLANGDTEITVIDWVGDNHRVDVFTKAESDAFYQHLSDFFDAGVARYGSVDEFARVLSWYNDLKAAA